MKFPSTFLWAGTEEENLIRQGCSVGNPNMKKVYIRIPYITNVNMYRTTTARQGPLTNNVAQALQGEG